MKAIVNGKRYNTETAVEISSYSRGSRGDFSRIEESLYKTRRGAYFLAGEGGPMSKYARACGQNQWTGGEGIQVLTEIEARTYCEQHDVDADVIAANFAVEEG